MFSTGFIIWGHGPPLGPRSGFPGSRAEAFTQ